ncbi:hypothetical protein OkiPb01551_02840 [Bordetella pertussis]|nr:hypothetical protein BPJ_17740 [Bordetella pertussis]BDT07773.1 hypothetical protein BP3J_14770 [Bordetella pertussis]
MLAAESTPLRYSDPVWLGPAGLSVARSTLPSPGDVMKNKALIAVLLAMAALSAGCNTVAGAGKDIERGGEKIQGAAQK